MTPKALALFFSITSRFPGFLKVFKKEGFLERMGMEGTPRLLSTSMTENPPGATSSALATEAHAHRLADLHQVHEDRHGAGDVHHRLRPRKNPRTSPNVWAVAQLNIPSHQPTWKCQAPALLKPKRDPGVSGEMLYPDPQTTLKDGSSPHIFGAMTKTTCETLDFTPSFLGYIASLREFRGCRCPNGTKR